MIIINDLNANGPRTLGFAEGEAGSEFSMLDTSRDGNVTAQLGAMQVPVQILIGEATSTKVVTIASGLSMQSYIRFNGVHGRR